MPMATQLKIERAMVEAAALMKVGRVPAVGH